MRISRDLTSTLNTNHLKDPVIQPPMVPHHSGRIVRQLDKFIKVSEEYDISEFDPATYDKVVS